MAKITKTFQYGKHQVTLETGEIARQAGGAVLVKVDGHVHLFHTKPLYGTHLCLFDHLTVVRIGIECEHLVFISIPFLFGQ